MAIKKLGGRISVLGHIKIGGKKRTKSTTGKDIIIPVKYDHFVVTTNDQDDLGYLPDDDLMQKLMTDQLKLLVSEHTEPIYNDSGQIIKTVQTVSTEDLRQKNQKLTRIVVLLPFDKIEDNLVTSLAVYDRDGCRCRGDAESADYIDPRTGEVTKVKCPCKLFMSKLNPEDDVELRYDHGKGLKPEPSRGLICKANGNLRVMIHRARTLGGIHIFRTTSLNSIAQLQSSMEQVLTLTGGGKPERGIMAGIPLVLELQPKRVVPGPNKKPQLAYVVALTRKAGMNEFLEQILKETVLRESLRKQIAAGEILSLPPPGRESPYEQAAIQEEFYSTTVVQEGTEDSENANVPDPEVVMDATSEELLEAVRELPIQEQPQEAPGATETPAAATEAPTPEKAASEEPATSVAETTINPTQDPAIITFGRFKPVDTRKPEGADTSPASKELRKAFFEATKTAGYTDEEVRNLLECLWKIQSSSKLQTWQLSALKNAL
jgi:hypothetical protein